MSIAAMKMALEALENPFDVKVIFDGNKMTTNAKEAIIALRAAIEAAEKQEPVATVVIDDTGLYMLRGNPSNLHRGMKLYAAPVVPDGWKLVPEEPTEEMLDHCERQWNELTAHTFGDLYKAMLAAAPEYGK